MKREESRKTKKALVLCMLVVCMMVLAATVSLSEGAKSITIREWMDATGECGECMLVVRIRKILNPVLAVVEDETGTVNLYSAKGEDDLIVNFMGDEGLTEGSVLVIASPGWNEYE